MALTDVTKPVIINATPKIRAESGDYLRRVCFVSLGYTTLQVGESKEVDKGTFQNILKGNSEFKNDLQSFFSFAQDKTAFILEVGEQQGTPLTKESYAHLKDFLLSQTWYNENEFFKYLYKKEWTKEADNKETSDILKQFWNSVGTFDSERYAAWLATNNEQDKPEMVKKFLRSYVDVAWDNNYYRWLSEQDNDFKALLTYINLHTYAQTLINYSDSDYDEYLKEFGDFEESYSEKCFKINEFIFADNPKCYLFHLPKQLSLYSALGVELLSGYNSTSAQRYFIVKTDDSALTESGLWQRQFQGMKSAIGIYDNGADKHSFSGAFAGVFASVKMDIKLDNPASPINYKAISGFKLKDISEVSARHLINSSLNFGGEIAGQQVILNGRCGDTYAFDYWYQWDLMHFTIRRDLVALILNGVNNPRQVIRYNQTGIDIIKARIKSSLKTLADLNCITDFSKTIDPITDEMSGKGDIEATEFYSYIRANPKDYENEIYGGVSFYVMIGRYIRQVVLSITLG